MSRGPTVESPAVSPPDLGPDEADASQISATSAPLRSPVDRTGGPGASDRKRTESRLEWELARRYLASRRRRGFLSLITFIAVGGISVGVMALIVVIGVMSGLQKDLREKILGASPHAMTLEIGSQFRMGAWSDVLERIRQVPEVTAAAPFVYTEILVSAGDNYSEGAVFRGVPNDPGALSVSGVGEHIVAGDLPFVETESGHPGILVGRGLADRLGLYVGRVVTVMSFQGSEITPTGMMPQMRRFEVTGVFSTGLYQYDTKFTFVDLAEAQSLLRLGDGVTGVEFNVADPWQADEVADRVEADLGYPYKVDDWQKQNASLFSALKLEKLAMAVILLLIVLVASFNIISTLVMVVSDKTREIGILRSMGLTARAIRRVFMKMGLVIGVVGTVVGGVLGGVLSWLLHRYQFITLPSDVYFVDRLPVLIDPLDVSLILIASVLISFLATVYPARRAAELTPVDAIRHE
jgi:lipoprotein-releasing system permease protein